MTTPREWQNHAVLAALLSLWATLNWPVDIIKGTITALLDDLLAAYAENAKLVARVAELEDQVARSKQLLDKLAAYPQPTPAVQAGGNWAVELEHLLNTAPAGAAERIIDAIDGGVLTNADYATCVYGRAYNDDETVAAHAATSYQVNGVAGNHFLEKFLIDHPINSPSQTVKPYRAREVRAYCAQWLARQPQASMGTATR